MNKNACKVVSLFSVLALASSVAFAADTSKLDPKKKAEKVVQAKIVKGKADIKVTDAAVKNSTEPAVQTRKGEYTCDIHIDNRTNAYINRIYIDGSGWGSVGRYGDALARDVAKGPTTVYAEVDYTDGSTGHYGPVVFNCESWSTHTWKLN